MIGNLYTPTATLMHPLLDFSLAQVPALYSRVIALRAAPNLDKIVFLRLIDRGDVVVDAGANAGYYTVLFSHLAGRRGQVHAFEPVPPTFALLAANVARSARFGNVRLNACGLADGAGTGEFLIPGTDLGQASLARHSAGSWSTPAEVQSCSSPLTTLDAYAAAHGMTRLDFVKCDVEGAELLVLRGGLGCLDRFQPLLHLEACGDWTASFGYDPAALVRCLAPFGYRAFYLVDQGLSRLAEPERQLAAGELDRSVNLLCAVPERHGERLARLRRWLDIRRRSRASRPAATVAEGEEHEVAGRA